MIVQCSKCGKKYKIDPAKVTEKGVKFSCQSCGNVMVVKKRAEEKPKEDFTPCSICGQPATQALDTPNPLCDRCHEIELEKASRFQDFSRDEGTPPPHLRREIELNPTEDVSFENLSGGDFAPPAYSTEVLPGGGESGAVSEEDKKKDLRMAPPKLDEPKEGGERPKAQQVSAEKKTIDSDKEKENPTLSAEKTPSKSPQTSGKFSSKSKPNTRESKEEHKAKKEFSGAVDRNVIEVRRLLELKEEEKDLMGEGVQVVEVGVSGESVPERQSSFPMFLSLLLLITLLIYYILKFVL